MQMKWNNKMLCSRLPCRQAGHPAALVVGAALGILFSLLPSLIYAQERVIETGGGLAPEGISRPLVLMLLLVALAMLPIVAMMGTAFVKLVVVLSMVRSALGTQQVPPATVITGLALILTVYVMTPVGIKMYDLAEKTIQTGTNEPLLSQTSVNLLLEGMKKAREPMREFLLEHTHPQEQKLFFSLQQMLRAKADLPDDKEKPAKATAPPGAPAAAEDAPSALIADEKEAGPDSFMVLLPAFVISELTEAFQIAFIIFLPFLVIDIVVTNVLLALGMFMVPPVTMSLPIKLLLFVMVDGWHILSRALLMGYT